MHLLGALCVFLPGHVVLRPATLLEKLKEAVGLEVDRATIERTLQHDAVKLIERLDEAMEHAGVTNATWMAVDEQVIFSDRKRSTDDLRLLDQLVREHASRLAQPFEELTVVFEHSLADLEVLIEGRIVASFRQGAPAIRLALGGRVPSLRRRQAEPQDQARARLTQMLIERNFLRDHQERFAQFVERLRQALHQIFSVQIEVCDARMVLIRPSPHYLTQLAELSLRGDFLWARTDPIVGPLAPPVIDPWDRYYEDLSYAWVDLMEIDEQVFAHAGEPVLKQPFTIIDTRGNVLAEGPAEEEQRQKLYSAHLAALHDYTEPDLRHADLKDYKKADGA